MADDLIRWIMERAVDKFGRDGEAKNVFNAAGFSSAWKETTGLKSSLDGRAVECMLHGRLDVKQLYGGAHYRLEERPKP